MYLKSLWLQHFRVFRQETLQFKSQVSVIVAPNATGKSTVLEAIYLLATGKSSRAQKIEEMISFGQELAYVKAKVVMDSSSLNSESMGGLDESQLELLLNRGEVAGRRTHKLHFSINENKRLRKDFLGNFLAVLFGPEDMRLIEGSPSRRRAYLDNILVQEDREYDFALKQYEQTLRRRNRLLSQIRDGDQSSQSLTFWDMSLIKHGELIQLKRRQLSEFMNSRVTNPLQFQIKYLPSVITQSRLASHRSAEIATGFTLIGPHKDDFKVLFEWNGEERGKSLNHLAASNTHEPHSRLLTTLNEYGSRGQKRLGVLWLKKSELLFLTETTGSKPVLLLDDIFSELDQENQQKVIQLIDQEQVIITTTDRQLIGELLSSFSGEIEIINLNENRSERQEQK